MTQPTVLIHFDETTGEFQIEAEGFTGLSCLDATQVFEQALGVVNETERTFKPESQPHLQTRTRIQQSAPRLHL